MQAHNFFQLTTSGIRCARSPLQLPRFDTGIEYDLQLLPLFCKSCQFGYICTTTSLTSQFFP